MASDPDESSPLPSPNIRAASYYIARARIACPHCGAITPLTAVALPPGHERLDEEGEQWQTVPANAILFYLEAVSQTVHALLRRAAPHLCFDSYWVNHCEHCERVLGDDLVHGEPGVGFTPLGADAAADIVLTEITAAFEAAAAGYSLEPELFAYMRRR